MASVRAVFSATATVGTGSRSITVTPAVGDLLVVISALSGNANASPACSDNVPASAGYSLVATAAKNSSSDTLACFVRKGLMTETTSRTITVDAGSNTSSVLVVLALQGLTRTGLSAIRQSATQVNRSPGGVPAPAFGGAALTSNPAIGAVFNGSLAPILTPPSSWTERKDLSVGFPTLACEIATVDSGFTGTTVTWDSGSASGFGAIIVELDSSAAIMIAGATEGTASAQATLDTPAALAGSATGSARAAAALQTRLRYATADIDTLPTWWDGRMVDEPTVTRSLVDVFWGTLEIQSIKFSLALNAALLAYHLADPRGQSLTLQRYDAASGDLRPASSWTITATGIVPGKLWVAAESFQVALLATLLPATTIEQTAYPNSPASLKGTPIPAVIGRVPQVPCPLINSDPENQIYDYAIGWNAPTGTPNEIAQLYDASGSDAIGTVREPLVESTAQVVIFPALASNAYPHVISQTATDRLFLVIIGSFFTGPLDATTTVSYGGQAATFVGAVAGYGGTTATAVWALRGGPAGAHNVVVTLPASALGAMLVVTSLSVTGTVQTGALTEALSLATAWGQDAVGPAISVTTSPGQLAISAALMFSGVPPPPEIGTHIRKPVGQTLLWETMGSSTGETGLSEGASRLATTTATAFSWMIGTPLDTPPVTDWTAVALAIAPAPTFTTDSSAVIAAYPGATVARFNHNPDPTAAPDAPPDVIRADVVGMQLDFTEAIAALISEPMATWGWGQSVDPTSFSAAKTALASRAGWPALSCDGAMVRQDEAQAWLRDLLSAAGMRLRQNDAGQFRLLVDTERTGPALALGDGVGDGPRNISGTDSEGRAWDEDTQTAKSLAFSYREDLLSPGSFAFSITRPISAVGVERPASNRFVREHATAQAVSGYQANRLRVGQEQVTFTATQEARGLLEGDLVRVDYAPLGYAAALMEVKQISDQLTSVDLTLRSYDSSIYTYAAGPDPVPTDVTPTDWQDTSHVVPGPATNLSITDRDTAMVGGVEVATVDLAWDAPTMNVAASIVRYRLSSFAEAVYPWTDGATVSGSGPGQTVTLSGLSPAETYDIAVRTRSPFKRVSIAEKDPELDQELMASPSGAPGVPLIIGLVVDSPTPGDVTISLTVTPPVGGSEGVNVYRSTLNDPRVGVLIGAATGGPGWTLSDTPPASGTYYYWGRSVASGGSPLSGPSPSIYNSVTLP